jgi:hypothetical protein
MTNRTLPSTKDRHFDPVAIYDHDASPRAFDTLWSLAGVVFIAAATTVLVGEDWPSSLVPASEAAESTAPGGTLVPPRLNTVALTADIHAARLSTEDVRHLQSKLTELGFAPGKIDGIAGGRTLNALNAYRASQNMEPATGVDYGTAAELLE